MRRRSSHFFTEDKGDGDVPLCSPIAFGGELAVHEFDALRAYIEGEGAFAPSSLMNQPLCRDSTSVQHSSSIASLIESVFSRTLASWNEGTHSVTFASGISNAGPLSGIGPVASISSI